VAWEAPRFSLGGEVWVARLAAASASAAGSPPVGQVAWPPPWTVRRLFSLGEGGRRRAGGGGI